jgi:Cu-Zn family superoxide dismutase
MKSLTKWMGPVAIAAALVLSWTAVSRSQQAAPAVPPDAAPVTAAIAVISPTTGNSTAGWVKFTQTDAGINVVADVTGLTPGKHGFHIHEWGDISDVAKGLATGGHYDPEGTHHHELIDASHADGSPHHAGDMGNLEADASGHAHLEETLQGITLMGPKDPIVGRAVIIHAGEDTGAQPVGNAGARVGQAVIGVANPAAK